MLCVTPKIHGAVGDSAVAESAPQTFALLPHLSKDSALQTAFCRCTPNSRLFIMHCHRIAPPTPVSSADAPAGPTSHRSALISINSNEVGSSFLIIPNNTASPLPSRHTQARRWSGCHAGRTDRRKNGQTDRRADRHHGHVISV